MALAIFATLVITTVANWFLYTNIHADARQQVVSDMQVVFKKGSLNAVVSVEPTKTVNEPVRVAETPQPAAETVIAAPNQPASSETEAEDTAFIYFKESSNRLDAQNSGGCKGLGQDRDGQLVIDCPNWQTDFACQDAYWERYTAPRYRTWVATKAHWLARVPINGMDVGNWR
ncbi:hypothetical protein NEK97_02460 [Paenarthrobacter sp. UW852]|uniref:aggregation-promoting factor C-terminal-like domain-containing protein n=1 Tax=Paenarthrobacter sp. UW852 TaxID=2951989 RepID=UPI0021490B00|nr:hypothetical protein [Paenarthrobacter sp. UW852]MCR1160323.1 hypothetical protein [Paenarthrobacter sp. UW852]